jgi:hypothetical protein
MELLNMADIEFTIEDDADIDAIRAKLKEVLKWLDVSR